MKIEILFSRRRRGPDGLWCPTEVPLMVGHVPPGIDPEEALELLKRHGLIVRKVPDGDADADTGDAADEGDPPPPPGAPPAPPRKEKKRKP